MHPVTLGFFHKCDLCGFRGTGSTEMVENSVHIAHPDTLLPGWSRISAPDGIKRVCPDHVVVVDPKPEAA